LIAVGSIFASKLIILFDVLAKLVRSRERMKTTPVTRILAKVAVFLSLLCSVSAQINTPPGTISTFADENPETGVVHIITVGNFVNPGAIDYAYGFYNNNQIVDDTARLSSAKLLSQVSATDWEIFQNGEGMFSYASTHTYDNIDENCGSAVDYANDFANVDMGNFFDYNTVAIVSTAWNIICNWFSEGLSAIWNAFSEDEEFSGE
jgi:hypothetical protein